MATPGLGEAWILQDTRSCVIPRPSDENKDTECSRHASKKFFYVYVDNLVSWERHARMLMRADDGGANAKESRFRHT